MNTQKFNKFFKDSRTNWKYILIVAILAFFVGAGILSYYYRWLPKQEIQITKVPEIKKLEKPEKIEEITKTPTIAGLVNDPRLNGAKEVYVSEKYAYVIGREYLTIIDISNPRNPNIVSSISDPKFIGCNGIYISDKYAYVVSEGSYAERVGPNLTIIDISIPPSPIIVGSITHSKLEGWAQGIYVLDKYAYVTAEFSKALTIIDVSDPKTPTIASSILISGPKILSWPYKIFVSDKYAYIASWGVGAETLVVDVSNPRVPTVVGRVSGPKDATDIYVLDKYAYVTGAEDILTIIDISNPTAPEIVGSIKDPQLESASGVYVSGKYAYVSVRTGLVIVDVSNLKEPVIVTSLSDRKLEGAEDPYVLGRYLYLPASYANNLAIIDLKGEIVFFPKPISILSEETLELKEKFIEEKEREIAFLQDGNIWVLGKDLKRKYKIVDTKEDISDFAISSGGKEIFWLNENGELWKKEEGKLAISLVGVSDKIEYEEYRKEYRKLLEYYREFLKESKGKDIARIEDLEGVGKIEDIGKVISFNLSPDGKYIAYEVLVGYTGCCLSPPNIPLSWIWIMKSDGTEKVKIEKPAGVWRDLIFFDGWLPDSKKILFHFQAADEPTQGSPFFEIGVDGKNPKIYTEIFKFFKESVEIKDEDITPEDLEFFTITVVGAEPVYSPTGEKVAYIKEESQIQLMDINTKEVKTILELENIPFDVASRILIWSEDGSLLLVKGVNKIFIFNKEGELVFETDFDAEAIESLIPSPDNKYLGGVYIMKKERIEIIFFVDFITKEKEEFKLPEFKDYLGTINIYPQFFSKSNRLYYLIEIRDEYPIHQLWVVDTNTWKNYKVADNVSQAARVP